MLISLSVLGKSNNIDINKKKSFDNDNCQDNDSQDNNENLDDNDILLLSTIHGVKGLEWEYVYLSGCSSDIIPSFKNNIYTEELENIQEERRLFYVGCSRAKKCLEITLAYDYHYVTNQIYASPFIRDLDENLYCGNNLIYAKRLFKGDVTHIINNYLLLCSNSRIYPYLKNLKCVYKSYFSPIIEPLIYKNRCDLVYGTFIDNLVTRMVYQKYSQYVDNMDIPIYEKINKRKDRL